MSRSVTITLNLLKASNAAPVEQFNHGRMQNGRYRVGKFLACTLSVAPRLIAEDVVIAGEHERRGYIVWSHVERRAAGAAFVFGLRSLAA